MTKIVPVCRYVGNSLSAPSFAVPAKASLFDLSNKSKTKPLSPNNSDIVDHYILPFSNIVGVFALQVDTPSGHVFDTSACLKPIDIFSG